MNPITAYERLNFIKFTRAVLQNKKSSFNIMSDAVNYIKNNNLDTNEKALLHYYSIK